MTDQEISSAIKTLQEEVRVLRAESDIRRLVARYMFLCDVPLPEANSNDSDRFREIVGLYTDDAVWEGIGPYYENQFGRSVGRAEITKHFERFFAPQDPAMIMNCHYLTSEQIHVTGETATGQWVHFQPWIFKDGSSVLRSSRLNNAFRCVDGIWKMSRYRTENVFIAPLPSGWATNIPEVSRVMHVSA